MRTDERIAVAMAELLRRQGYAATGIKQVVEASGAPIGSLYHHFPGGKRAVAEAALRQSGAAYGELVASLLAPYGDIAAGIEAAFIAAADDMEHTGWVNMCPVGTVAGEVVDVEPELRTVAAEVFEGWIEGGAALFRERGLTDDDARALITAVISALEGAFVLSRTLRSRDPLIAAGRGIAAYARELLADPMVRSG
ncbi:TetR/AcrR family transcriptional regulator [Gordonia sp. LSe1-13]|uniref:TetR/AcrR family transcriptional regulator n=1 Tax=Gordonia sesuvii TaxID=3116777 RepID=A0ABU7M853_9ACTN|nr:TetR/AcrR family transcriptional regulator [Gordonia sp. LSe1-13]